MGKRWLSVSSRFLVPKVSSPSGENIQEYDTKKCNPKEKTISSLENKLSSFENILSGLENKLSSFENNFGSGISMFFSSYPNVLFQGSANFSPPGM